MLNIWSQVIITFIYQFYLNYAFNILTLPPIMNQYFLGIVIK